MGAVVTVTIGSDSFSVYALATDAVAEATTYFNGRLGADATAWAAATSDNRKKALVTAADWMDRAIEPFLSGTRTVSTQPRAFPRDGASCNGTPITDGTTPDDVARAEFWLAGQLLLDSSIATGTGQGSNIKQAVAGSASVTFFTPTIGSSRDTRLPVTAMDYLKCLFSGANTAIAAGFASGVSNDSAFDPCDFKRSEGF
jgi:hypothetical protein